MIFSLSILLLYTTDARGFEGPLQVKNQFPLFIHINQPYLERAAIEDSFSVSLSHSSTFTVQESGHWSFGLDMEITEIGFRYKKNIDSLFELGIEVPVLSFNSGFLDGFLAEFHGTFGLPDYGRSTRPLHEFLYEIRRDGVLIVKGGAGDIGLGDIRLTAKRPLLLSPSEGFELSIKADLELPTGNAKRGYGNGNMDAGISALLDKSVSESIMTYWNLGVVFLRDIKGYEEINLSNFIYGGAAIEAFLGEKFSMLCQLTGQSSPYPKTDLLAIDRPAFLLSIGGRYYSDENSFELSFTEDPNAAGAPDFILNFSFKRRL